MTSTARAGSLVLCLTLAVALVGCPAPEGDPASELVAAAEEAGVEIREGEIYTVSRGDESLVAAPVAGWENIPASELTNGVDFAFARFTSAEGDLPEGFYTLRATGDGSAVGSTEAQIEMIDGSGNVAGTISGVAEIHATTLPEPLPFDTTFITSLPARDGRTHVWLRCPNGVCIRIPIFRPLPIPFPPVDLEAPTRQALEEASRRADVGIDATQTFAVFRSDGTVATAPVTSWADIGADQLPDGVDFGFAFISSESIPAGYYTLRVFAEPSEPGLVDARVELLDARGEVVNELPAQVEVHSMTVPEERPFPGTIITTLPDQEAMLLWYQCSNGQCVRLRLI